MVSKHLITILLLLSFYVVSTSGAQRDANRLFILGGELSNSAATSVEDVDEVMPRMAPLGLNTVLVPAYWDLIGNRYKPVVEAKGEQRLTNLMESFCLCSHSLNSPRKRAYFIHKI